MDITFKFDDRAQAAFENTAEATGVLDTAWNQRKVAFDWLLASANFVFLCGLVPTRLADPDKNGPYDFGMQPVHAWVEINAQPTASEENTEDTTQRIANSFSPGNDGPPSGALFSIPLDGVHLTFWLCDEDEGPTQIYRRYDGSYELWI